MHHYPTPIADIQLFKYDDFQLWVTDQQGNPAAVAPVDQRGSGNASVHVLYATPGSQLAQQKHEAESAGAPLILGPDHPLSVQAYQNQQAPAAPLARGPVAGAVAAGVASLSRPARGQDGARSPCGPSVRRVPMVTVSPVKASRNRMRKAAVVGEEGGPHRGQRDDHAGGPHGGLRAGRHPARRDRRAAWPAAGGRAGLGGAGGCNDGAGMSAIVAASSP